MAHGLARGVWVRARAAAARLAEVGVVALAVATLVGLVLDEVRPGAAVHALWMGTTGSPAADAWLAGAFAAVVLLHRASWRRGGPARRAWGRPRSASSSRASRWRPCCATARRWGTARSGRPGGRRRSRWSRCCSSCPGRWPPRPACVAPPPRMRASLRFGRLVGVGALLAASEIAAMGATDYRAPADAIVVLGARVHADGRPSGALRDRVVTACRLWRAGLAPVLVLSGGRGADAPVSEPLAMAALALAEGVPEEALLLDEERRRHRGHGRASRRGPHPRAAGGMCSWCPTTTTSPASACSPTGRASPCARSPRRRRSRRVWKAVAFPREVAAYAAEWFLGLGRGRPRGRGPLRRLTSGQLWSISMFGLPAAARDRDHHAEAQRQAGR